MLAVSLRPDFPEGAPEDRIVGSHRHPQCPIRIGPVAARSGSIRVSPDTVAVELLRLPGAQAQLKMIRKSMRVAGCPERLVGQETCRLMMAVPVLGIPLPLGDDDGRPPGPN